MILEPGFWTLEGMKKYEKLLNTVYITNEQMYLALDGKNLVCKVGDEIKLRIPFDNVENIVCFSYLGCSPVLNGQMCEASLYL